MNRYEKANTKVKIINKLLITVLFLFIFFIFVLYRYSNSNPSRVVEGNIFAYQIKVFNKYEPFGYIAFGSDRESYGVLLYKDKNTIDEANKNGDLANQLYDAAKNHMLVWNPDYESKIIDLDEGLALSTGQDDPFFPVFSISVDNISGIFKKNITGKNAFTNFAGGSGTNNVRLVKIGKIQEP